MSTRDESRPDLMPGTLDLLILQTLRRREMHGYGIAQRLREVSEDVLRVEEASLPGAPAAPPQRMGGGHVGRHREQSSRALLPADRGGTPGACVANGRYTRLTLAILRVLETP
jgi:hypothetical protein